MKITTIDGEVLFPIKAGTQTDTKIRLKGKGVPTLRNKNVRGDHYVTLVVDVPDKLTKEQKEALLEFDRLMGDTLGLGADKQEAPEDDNKDKDGEKPKKKKGLFGK